MPTFQYSSSFTVVSALLNLLLEHTKMGKESVLRQLSLLPKDYNYQSKGWDRQDPYNFRVHIPEPKHTFFCKKSNSTDHCIQVSYFMSKTTLKGTLFWRLQDPLVWGVPLGTELLGYNFQIIKGYNHLQNSYLGTVDFPVNLGFGGKKMLTKLVPNISSLV